jgi:hypothetical protein
MVLLPVNCSYHLKVLANGDGCGDGCFSVCIEEIVGSELKPMEYFAVKVDSFRH